MTVLEDSFPIETAPSVSLSAGEWGSLERRNGDAALSVYDVRYSPSAGQVAPTKDHLKHQIAQTYNDGARLFLSDGGATVTEFEAVLRQVQEEARLQVSRADGENAGARKSADLARQAVFGVVSAMSNFVFKQTIASDLLIIVLPFIFLDLQKQKPPPAPTGEDIEAIVRGVVVEELDRQDAEEAATSFLLVAHRLAEFAERIYDRLTASGFGPHSGDPTTFVSEEFRDYVRSIELYQDSTKLLVWLEHLHRQPEIAKFVFGAYHVGVAASLHVKRAYLENAIADGDRVTTGDLDRYIAHAEHCIASLEGARRALDDYVRAKLTDHKLISDGGALMPGAEEIQSIYYRKHTGWEGAGFAEAADELTAKLRSMVELVGQARQALDRGRMPSTFINVEPALAEDEVHGGWEELPVVATVVSGAGDDGFLLHGYSNPVDRGRLLLELRDMAGGYRDRWYLDDRFGHFRLTSIGATSPSRPVLGTLTGPYDGTFALVVLRHDSEWVSIDVPFQEGARLMVVAADFVLIEEASGVKSIYRFEVDGSAAELAPVWSDLIPAPMPGGHRLPMAPTNAPATGFAASYAADERATFALSLENGMLLSRTGEDAWQFESAAVRLAGPPGLALGTVPRAGGYTVLRRHGDEWRRLPDVAVNPHSGLIPLGGTWQNPLVRGNGNRLMRLRDPA